MATLGGTIFCGQPPIEVRETQGDSTVSRRSSVEMAPLGRMVGADQELGGVLTSDFAVISVHETGTLHERFFVLKQETTVADYREKFEEYFAPLDNLDDDTLEEKFIDGLRKEIKVEMRINLPLG